MSTVLYFISRIKSMTQFERGPTTNFPFREEEEGKGGNPLERNFSGIKGLKEFSNVARIAENPLLLFLTASIYTLPRRRANIVVYRRSPSICAPYRYYTATYTHTRIHTHIHCVRLAEHQRSSLNIHFSTRRDRHS